MDRLATGNFNGKGFLVLRCMQGTSRFATKNFNGSREFVKISRFTVVVELCLRLTSTVL